MPSRKKRQPKNSLLIIWLLFLPLLLFGIFLLGLTVQMINAHLQALSWQPVNATLLARYAEHDSQKLGRASRHGGKFSYVWQDRVYESTQLSFSRMYASSAGSQIDDWDARLHATIGSPGQQFTARVNPDNPTEAVALSAVRWVEVAIYLGFGLLLVWASYLFLVGMQRPQNQPAVFSWRAVAIMSAIGLPLLVLSPLLWRDQHGVWAVVVALPALLALHGVVHGLRLRWTVK
jgi:hypothetical protein